LSQNESIEARIIAELAKMKKTNPEAIRSETRLIEDLDIDSLDSFDLLFQLEEEFVIEISPVDLLHFCSVGDVIAYVQQRLGSVIPRRA
jgi:acyl carrier protein